MNSITIAPDGSGTVVIGEYTEEIEADSYAAAQNKAIDLAVFHAQQAGTSLTIHTNDPDAPVLVVSPTGEVEPQEEAPAPPAAQPVATAESAVVESPENRSSAPTDPPAPAAASAPAKTNPFTSTAEGHPKTPLTRRELRSMRESFLNQEQPQEPAARGWRGALSAMGIRVKPSAAEKQERADRKAVSQHWPGPRTIAIVNGKGGANKTPTTINLSAVFARFGGGGVLAWDNNQTRGTLGWRTEQGPHESTILDLLPRTNDLLATGAQSADLARYVHHQTSDRYDVLRSKPLVLADEQRVSAADVDSIHAVASKFYRLILIDSGNDESDPLWKRMIDHADQIVVASTTKDEHAEAGALLLEGLAARDERCAQLADEAVVIVSQAEPSARREEAEKVRNGFAAIAREVVQIPFDPAIVDGLLRYDALRPATQRAWLRAAAAVARGL
ncbi:AAA family ATPase [Nesterenkonia sp.]|uniref:AAA family ATPase n=1 Tax=Nesterenkonia sp. TaxID=704201 RepID=UPI002630C797|nr:AAA family ATPase [Nesterenkonia sp.]